MAEMEDAVVLFLLDAAAGVIPAPDREPWAYGWAFEDYRRSERAALPGPEGGAVCMTHDALTRWEAGLDRLSKETSVRLRWDVEEMGGLIASLTVAASTHPERARRAFLESSLSRFRSAGPAFVAQLISNVSWLGGPVELGGVLVGEAGDDLFESVKRAAAGRIQSEPSDRERWLEEQVDPRVEALDARPVAICCWTTGQMAKGLKEAERRVRDLLNLPLLLERDLASHGIFRRGDVNRPGLRGLSLDRGAVEHALRSGTLSVELAALPLLQTEVLSGGSPVHWYGAEPLPLGVLLQQQYLRAAITRGLEDTPIGRRLRVGARWIAEAHYATAPDDAALALGVALDALLGGESALPGSAMGDRAALLVADASQRRTTRKRYLDFYGIRSAVAHGGQSSKLNEAALAGAFSLARTTAWRLLAFADTFKPTSDRRVDDLFEELRLGLVAWPQASDDVN